MTDISVLLPPKKTAISTPQRPPVRGVINIAAGAVTDPTVSVIVPGHTSDYSVDCRWVRQGDALPQAGADCLIVYDETGAGTVVSWEGAGVSLLAIAAAIDARLDALEAGPETVRYVGAVGQPAFAHSWVNFDSVRPAGFYRYGGRVYLTGLIKSGTVGSSAFTLPSDCLPADADASNPITFGVDSNTAYGRLSVFGDGTVTPAAGSNAFFHLAGVDFRHT